MKLERRKPPAIGFMHGREVAKESQNVPPIDSMETQFAFPRDESVF